ncbi:GatB/YqeY domain-containing protein [Burkholderia ubonensis]|uniref:GatB/YqeY domain-containing protein n=1 Tax=Burkholderia ubonensis TaxID=101571 RepID=UPI000B04D091|nr:GatB/YqeY domain-containing protein [Burkholderia ubonensis]
MPRRFPGEAIKATGAEYCAHGGPTGLASVSVALAPFEFNGEMLATSLRCDGIELDFDDFSGLASRSLLFPPNPEPGYIDGSIYLLGVHVFFITSRLTFGEIGDETIPLGIEGTLEFGSSGLTRYEDARLRIETELRLPLTAAQIASIAADAVEASGAQSPRDIGKVMARLANDPRAAGRMAELGAEIRRRLGKIAD